MNTIRTDFSFNLNIELNLSDSQLQKLYDVYGPDFDSELNKHLQRYVQSSLIFMLENIRVDTEFMIEMQLKPNSRKLDHVTIGANYLNR